MNNKINLKIFLKDISKSSPCGINLKYDKLLDEIKHAAKEDDPNLPQGIWQAEVKKADWNKVEELCIIALCEKSKDITLISWLSEAWMEKYGIMGFKNSISLLHLMLERYGKNIYPIFDERSEARQRAIYYYFSCIKKHIQNLPLLIDDGTTFSFSIYDLKQGEINKSPSQHKLDEINHTLFEIEKNRINKTIKELDEALGVLCKLKKITKFFDTIDTKILEIENLISEVIKILQNALLHKKQISPVTEKKPDKPSLPLSEDKAYQALQHIEKYLIDISPQSPANMLIQLAITLGRENFTKLADIGNEQTGFALSHLVNLYNSVKAYKTNDPSELTEKKIEEILLKNV